MPMALTRREVACLMRYSFLSIFKIGSPCFVSAYTHAIPFANTATYAGPAFICLPSATWYSLSFVFGFPRYARKNRTPTKRKYRSAEGRKTVDCVSPANNTQQLFRNYSDRIGVR